MSSAKSSKKTANQSKTSVRFELCQTPEKTAVLRAVTLQIMNLKRLIPVAVLSTVLAFALIWVWGGQESMKMMVLLSAAIAMLEWGMILYLNTNRLKLLTSIREMDGVAYTVHYDGNHLMLVTDKFGSAVYEHGEIVSQYWMEEHYFLLLEHEKTRRLIHLPVEEETFDDILALATALEHQKIKFVRLKKKKAH